jgi:hypothetical protein
LDDTGSVHGLENLVDRVLAHLERHIEGIGETAHAGASLAERNLTHGPIL